MDTIYKQISAFVVLVVIQILVTFFISYTRSSNEWVTYVNSEYGFQFEYPASWVMQFPDAKNDLFLVSVKTTDPRYYQELFVSLRKGQVSNIYKARNYCEKTETVIFAGKEAFKSICGDGGDYSENYAINLTGNIYMTVYMGSMQIDENAEPLPKNISENILNSFKIEKNHPNDGSVTRVRWMCWPVA